MSDPALAAHVRPFPRVLRIEPAGACNLRCSHCPTGTIAMSRGVMPPETFARVLRDLEAHADAVKVVVLYHGGEPLLNKRFVDMVRAVKGAGVPFVKTVSNGMLLGEATAEALVTSGLDAIEFSLDAESAAENDFVRRECEFATVAANVKRLLARRRALGATRPQVFLSSTQFLPPAAGAPRRATPPPPAYLVREFAAWADDIAGFKCAWAMRWPHMEVLEDVYDLYQDPADVEERNHCDKVVSTMTVRWNGEVVACCYDLTSRHVLGNVREDDLATIWNNARYLALRRSIAERTFVPLCAGCNEVKPGVYLTLKPGVRARLERAPAAP